ncbi:MAG: hypothetical protein J6W64_07250 [Bacilli bacterium]|nr:hypothetical protein [Bacilli bacterium]
MKKFVKFKLISVANVEDQDDEERAVAGFSEEPKKKKKRTKKVRPILGDLIVALDSILSVVCMEGQVELTTLDGTFLIADNINYINKLLKVK